MMDPSAHGERGAVKTACAPRLTFLRSVLRIPFYLVIGNRYLLTC